METLFGKKKEYLLKLDGKKYCLFSVEPDGYIGYGGLSIVYKAREEGEHKDYVVIKEFYPQQLNIKRKKNGSIHVNDEEKPEYEKLTERVINESDIVDILRHKGDKNNPWVFNCSKPIKANNTFYTVIATESGDMLSGMINNGFFKDKDFAYICDCILKILDALKPIHDQNYLHLDISPGNVHFSDLGVARLIDFNSAFKLGSDPKNWHPSHTPGYSADEIENFDDTKPMPLSYQTDFYSIAAIFSKLLFGRPPEDDDWRPGEWLQLASESEYLKGASNLLVKKTSEFLERGLKITPEYRFKDIIEMREAVEELKKLRTELEVVNFRKDPNEYFVCREFELNQIREILNKNNYVILEGMGGIGKTELVKKYAQKHKEDYDIIQFVNFNNNIESTVAFSLLFNNFNDSWYSKTYGNEAVAYMYRDKMASLKDKKYEKQVLIIIDNFDREDDIKFLEFTTGNYKVIFTSREKHEGKVFYELPDMKNADLLKLFSAYYAPFVLAPEDETIVDKIISLVLGHTMTVMLIASAMKKSVKTPKEMLELLKNGLDPRLRTKITLEKEGISDEDRSKVMYEHIKTLFDMTEIKANNNYSFVMTNMAIVPYTGMEIKIFYDWALKEHYKSKEYNDEDYSDLNDLIDRRWIQYTNKCVSLHPIISDIANEELKPDSQKCALFIENMIGYRFNGKNKTHTEWTKIMRMSELACKRIRDETEKTGHMLYAFAYTARFLANYNTALFYFKKNLVIFAKVFGIKHPITIAVSYNIADIYCILGKYHKALYRFQTILEISEDMPGTYYANACHKIGIISFYMKDYSSALEWLQKALHIREMWKFIDTAETYKYIGLVYVSYCKYSEALEYFSKALDIFEKGLGIEHEDTADVYIEIANIYFHQGKYLEAEELLQKTFIIFEKRADNEEPETAQVFGKIADVYFKQGMYSKALKLYMKGKTIAEKVYGMKNMIPAKLYYSIAFTYYQRKIYLEALEWFQKAVDIKEKVLGEHYDTAISYNAIACTYYKLKEYIKALKYFKKALIIFLKESDMINKYYYISETYYNIAFVFKKLKIYTKAKEWLRKAGELEIYEVEIEVGDPLFVNNETEWINNQLGIYDIDSINK